MVRPSVFFPCAIVLFAAHLGTAHADSSVEGSVRLEHGDWTAVDAIAYPDGDEIEVVFSDIAFDREAIFEDGVANSFDAMRHSGNTLTVNVDVDGPTMCVDLMSRSEDTMYSGSSCRSEFVDAIEIESQTADRIVGAVNWGEPDDEHIHLQFDVGILGGASGGMLGGPGEPLPADGGEPGKAVLLHFEALEAGDWERLKASAHPEGRAMMEESEASGEHLEMFEMLRAFAPKDIRITGGAVSGDTAHVNFEADEDGASVSGIATVIRFEDQWYYRGSETSVSGGGTTAYIPEASGGYTSLMMAIVMGQTEAVSILLQDDPDLSARTPEGKTVAILAAESGNPDIVAALLDAGADFQTGDGSGNTPVLAAILASSGSEELYAIIEMLATHGVNLDQASENYTPLSYAVQMGDTRLVEALLEAGADPNHLDNAGRSALEYARDMYMEQEVALLLAHGAIDDTSSESSTALEATDSASAEASGSYAMPSAPASFSVPSLPRYAGTTVLFEQDAIAIYVTADEVAKVAEETLSLLQSAGWQGRLTAETPTMKHLTFDQDNAELTVMVSIAPAQGNKTTIQYSLLVK